MTRQNPHYPERKQYTSYYQGRPQAYPQDPVYPQGEFAPPKRPSRFSSYTRAMPPQANVPVAPPRQPRPRSRPRRSRSFLIAGSSVLALAALVVGPRPLLDNQPEEKTSDNAVCQETVQSTSVLSRAELSELLAVAERSPKEDVRAVIDEPYCTLPSVEVREGAIAEREAYPLEFNPQTWFIVLYEEGEYAGFDFSFDRK